MSMEDLKAAIPPGATSASTTKMHNGNTLYTYFDPNNNVLSHTVVDAHDEVLFSGLVAPASLIDAAQIETPIAQAIKISPAVQDALTQAVLTETGAAKVPPPQPETPRVNLDPTASSRAGVLQRAASAVLKDRNLSYGPPEQSFATMAQFWTILLGKKLLPGMVIEPHEVVLAQDLLKTTRLMANPFHQDSWDGKAGYAACGPETVGGAK